MFYISIFLTILFAFFIIYKILFKLKKKKYIKKHINKETKIIKNYICDKHHYILMYNDLILTATNKTSSISEITKSKEKIWEEIKKDYAVIGATNKYREMLNMILNEK